MVEYNRFILFKNKQKMLKNLQVLGTIKALLERYEYISYLIRVYFFFIFVFAIYFYITQILN